MKNYCLKGLLAVSLVSSLWSCSDDITSPSADVDNAYAQVFIKEFGIPDPSHDWSMATQAGLVLKSSKATSVQVLAEIKGVRYIFADLQNFKGTSPVPVTIPKTQDELIIVANGIEKVCPANATVDIDQMLSARSRTEYTYDNDNVSRTQTSEDYIEIDIADEDNSALRTFIGGTLDKDGIAVTNKNSEKWTAKFEPQMCWWYSGTWEVENGEKIYKMGDFDVIPLYVRRAEPTAPIDFTLGVVHRYFGETNIGFYAPLNNEYGEYSIKYKATEDDQAQFTTQPDLTTGLWELPVTKFRVAEDASGSAYTHGGITFYSEKDGVKSFSFNDFNRGEWNDEDDTAEKYFDVTLGERATYYNAAIVTTISVKQTNGEMFDAYICGIYFAPTEAHQTRASQPDAYFMLRAHGNKNVTSTSTGYQTWRWRVLAEDLGGSYDFDFNDIVFDVTEIQKSYLPYEENENKSLAVARSVPAEVTGNFPTVKEVTVIPRAAGGVIPLYVTWHGQVYKPNDYLKGKKVSELLANNELVADPEECTLLIGDEIHQWLGANSTDITNTSKITNSGRNCTFITPVETNVLNGFTIIVDENNAFNKSSNGASYVKIDDIPENSSIFTKVTHPDKGSANPQFITVDQNVPWPTERTPIHQAYTGFSQWVENQADGKEWFNTWVTGKVVDEPNVKKPGEE